MEPDEIANLIEAAERWYDSTFDLNRAENVAREADRNGTPHTIAHASCLLYGQKAECLRASGALLHAVEAYRAKEKVAATDDNRMRDALRAAEKRELQALAELDEAKAAIRIVIETDCLKSHAFEQGDNDASIYDLLKNVVRKP